MSTGVSFEQLYGDDKNEAAGLVLIWANAVLKGFGLDGSAAVDMGKVYEVVQNLNKATFPAAGGFDAASPFKKAAYFYVWLHAVSPFPVPLTAAQAGAKFARFPNNLTSLIGFSIIKACLHGATLNKKDGAVATLTNPIQVSEHFMIDLIEDSSAISPANHFRVYSILFEALAYEANPGICYQKAF